MSFQQKRLGLWVALVCVANVWGAGDSVDGDRGSVLAAWLRNQRPELSQTNTAMLVVRESDARRSRVPVTTETTVEGANWIQRYRSVVGGKSVTLSIRHSSNGKPTYEWTSETETNMAVATQIWGPFLGSDFWIADLGMEFLHWPQQRIVKQEVSNGRLCDILESTNPMTNGAYATVRSAVDVEQKLILSAEAFDAQRRRIKQFAIKGAIEIRGATFAGLIITDDLKGSKSELMPDERHGP